MKFPGQLRPNRRSPEIEDFASGADRDGGCGGTALNCAAGKILGKFGVPFTGLRSDGAMGSSALFCCAA
jgi:hypothetical protein